MRLMHWIQIAAFLACIGSSDAAQCAPQGPQKQVRRFIAAFNAQDSDAMLALTHADIEWHSVDGDRLSTETRGREQLRAFLKGYFKSCPSCRSKLTKISHTATRVSAVEVASWQTSNGRKTQRSLSIYELDGGLIRRVYYFSAEP